MDKPDAQFLLDRFVNDLKLDPEVDEFTSKKCREEINDFVHFARKVLPILKRIRE